jgi:hypothetical protein
MAASPGRDIFGEYIRMKVHFEQGISLPDMAERVFRFYFVYVTLRQFAESDSFEQLGNAADSALLRRQLGNRSPNRERLHSHGNDMIQKVLKDKVSSLYYLLEDAFASEGLVAKTDPVPRLIILAILAKRMTMIKAVALTFSSIVNPFVLAKLLQPFTDLNIDGYKDVYLSQNTDMSNTTKKISTSEMLDNCIRDLGKTRIKQNLMIRDLLTVRYLLIQLISSPHLFTPASLGTVNRILTETQITLKGEDTRMFTAMNNILVVMSENYNRVWATLEAGNAITREVIRRLEALLTIVKRTEMLTTPPSQPKEQAPPPVIRPLSFSSPPPRPVGSGHHRVIALR